MFEPEKYNDVFIGGKSYSLQTEDKKKNDELIMESAKKLHGGLLLTDDKNLLVSDPKGISTVI